MTETQRPFTFSDLQAALVLVAVLLVAYIPAMRAGYIWDDDDYVTENVQLRSPGGLVHIWTDPQATPQYYPLVHTTYWIEYRLYGLLPAGYHVVNILLHALGAVLLWRVLARLSIPAPWLIAAVFALHPVHVESVAWITERKNVLSGVFYLASLLAYLRFAFDETKPRSPYALSFAFFVAALLSKTVTATLPAVILVLLWWKRGRILQSDAFPLLPFFAIGIAMGMLTAWLEKSHVGASGAEWELSPATRLAIAGRVPWFYAGKLLWPAELTFIYPRWSYESLPAVQLLWPAATLLTLITLYVARRRIGRDPLAAVLIFIGTLAPALGFIDVYPFRYSFVADHFQYLASIPIIALIVGGAAHYVGRLTSLDNRIRGALAAGLLIVLASLTFAQSRIYRDEETLWKDTISKNPNAAIAHTNLGAYYAEHGDYARAAAVLSMAAMSIKDDPDIYGNLGGALVQLNRFQEAEEALLKSLELQPDNPWTLNNLGLVYLRTDRTDRAIETFERALKLHAGLVETYNNLAVALDRAGRTQDAIAILSRGLELHPNEPALQQNLTVLSNR